MAPINAATSTDDASTLSGTDKGNAKSTRLLHNYSISYQQSGTTRMLVKKKDLIPEMLWLTFKKLKFINSNTNLHFEGKIAKVLMKKRKKSRSI